VTSSDTGHLNEVNPAGDGMLSDSHRTRSRPVREHEGDSLLTSEFHTAVVRQKDINLDPGATERPDEPTGRGGEAANGGQWRELGGREGDAHLHIVVDRRPERT